MRFQRVLALAAVIEVLSFQIGAGFASPISTDGSDPKTWDAKSDGPIAAPANHKVIFENENIRILSVTVLPGTQEPYHSHPNCSVLVFDSPAKVADHNRAGEVTPRFVVASIPWLGKSVSSNIPFVAVQPPQASHSIANNDTHVLHLIRIEMKKGCEHPPN
jgi:hypothetical protein